MEKKIERPYILKRGQERRRFLAGSLALLLLFLVAIPVLAHPPLQGGTEGTVAYRDLAEITGLPWLTSRVGVWIAAQLHLLFAAFVLAVPMFALVVEIVGWRSGDMRYDRLAKEFTRLLMAAFSTTAVFGAILLFMLTILYPAFWSYLAGIFSPTMFLYALLFFGEGFSLYIYYYGWERMMERKGWHIFIGVMLNVFGTLLMFIANAWLTFAISPAGIDPATGQLSANYGGLWAAINNPTWWPINIHRLIANVAFGGSITGFYAAVKFLGSKTDDERAHYDWMGYVGNFIAVIGLLPLPFAGYYLGREIYGFNQQMGITMMGGFLSWLWIIQALLIGVLFLSANYYLWIGMGRIEGGERYRGYVKYLLFVVTLGFLVWATPHSLVASLEEARKIGGAHHPLLGVLGVMSAKNTAVNLMILATFVSFLIYRRAGKGQTRPFREHGVGAVLVLIVVTIISLALLSTPLVRGRFFEYPEGLSATGSALATISWGTYAALLLALVGAVPLAIADRGKLAQGLIIGVTAAVVITFGVYGYFVTAIVRIGFSIYQVTAVLATFISVVTLDLYLFRNAENVGTIRWGKMPERSQYILILLAVTFTWLMGLMGYARNAIRQYWHVYEVVRDTSSEAFAPNLGYAATIISVCVLLFIGLVSFIFWLGGLGEKVKKPAEAVAPTPAAATAPRVRSPREPVSLWQLLVEFEVGSVQLFGCAVMGAILGGAAVAVALSMAMVGGWRPSIPSQSQVAPTAGEETPALDVSSSPGTESIGDPAKGQELFINCAACHGPDGRGIPGLGKDLTTSEFVESESDQAVLQFIKAGRPVNDPLNTTGLAMPPKGGNPALTDTDLSDIVAYIRTLQ